MILPTSRRRRLGSDLRRLREQAGISGRAMATRLGVSQPTIVRIESGERLASMPEVVLWAKAVNVSEEVTERLLADVEAVYTEIETWRSSLSGGDELEARAISMETAKAVRYFTVSVVPGLMQTAEYARRNIELGIIGATRDVPSVVADRMQRQHLLYDADRSFTFLMTENALRWPVGPPSVMRGQLDRVISTIGLGNVRIGVIPLDHAPRAREAHAFGIFEGVEGGQTFVHIELAHGMVTITDPDDVASYEMLWERLAATALFGEDAAGFIRSLATELRER